jgi:hypothetical protein
MAKAMKSVNISNGSHQWLAMAQKNHHQSMPIGNQSGGIMAQPGLAYRGVNHRLAANGWRPS